MARGGARPNAGRKTNAPNKASDRLVFRYPELPLWIPCCGLCETHMQTVSVHTIWSFLRRRLSGIKLRSRPTATRSKSSRSENDALHRKAAGDDLEVGELHLQRHRPPAVAAVLAVAPYPVEEWLHSAATASNSMMSWFTAPTDFRYTVGMDGSLSIQREIEE